MNAATGTSAASPALDVALLLQRLERLLVDQGDFTQAARLLGNRALWRRLGPDQALRWATLAEIAGLPELSLEILNHLLALDPKCEAALRRRSELTGLLGPAAAPPAAPSQSSAAGETPPAPGEGSASPGPCDSRSSGPRAADPTPLPADAAGTAAASVAVDPEPVTAPFAALRLREQRLERFLELFAGREDCFARQWVDRDAGTQGYVPVRRALTAEDLVEHLRGQKTYGIYLLRRDSRVLTAVIDADLAKTWRTGAQSASRLDLLRREKRYLLHRLPELAAAQGLPCLVEFSGGKGFHFWFPAAAPVPAAVARRALQRLVKGIESDLQCFTLEVFPKQDQLAGSGLGNLVKLPLGVHRATGRRSFFFHLQDRDPWAQLAIFEKAPRLPVAAFERAAGGAGEAGAEVVVHPRHREWAAAYPELATLAERCPALGHMVTDCRQRRELSPRDEKILLQTVGFLPRARTLVHHLFQHLPDYNPHLVDYRLSRLRGTPLGCKRIHSLLGLALDFCRFERSAAYPHPLLHWPDWRDQGAEGRAERVVNLQDAIERLRAAMKEVERFLLPA